MSRVKELAKELRLNACRHRDPNGDKWDYYDAEHTNKLLELIDGAKEATGGGCPECNGGVSGPGTYLFFPDPQPTLEEAARAVLMDYDGVELLDGQTLADIQAYNLKAALEREKEC